MAGRWPAVAFVLLLAAACSRGRGDPVVAEPSTTAPPPTTAPAAGYKPPVVLGHIADPAIRESSGLVASRRNPGLLWTHNDSGDEPYLYCLDMQAKSCGTWRVTGAQAFDWEDIAAGPGPRPGEPYLYVGDIGDNTDQRSQIVVYRVSEPVAGGSAPVPTTASPAPTAPADALRLRYPDGPHDAEALLVHPASGDVYVITKDMRAAGVYKAAAPVDITRPTILVRVATIRLEVLEQVTGGDISPDGRGVALSTYLQGYELELAPGGSAFDDVWAQAPVPVALGDRQQGEAIAYRLDGRALLATSEGVASPLIQVERR